MRAFGTESASYRSHRGSTVPTEARRSSPVGTDATERLDRFAGGVDATVLPIVLEYSVFGEHRQLYVMEIDGDAYDGIVARGVPAVLSRGNSRRQRFEVDRRASVFVECLDRQSTPLRREQLVILDRFRRDRTRTLVRSVVW